jgi:hypothetical protein
MKFQQTLFNRLFQIIIYNFSDINDDEDDFGGDGVVEGGDGDGEDGEGHGALTPSLHLQKKSYSLY